LLGYKWREADVVVYGGDTTSINWAFTVVDPLQTVTAIAEKDTYVNNSASTNNSNYGSALGLSVGNASIGGDNTRIYIQFNLSSSPLSSIPSTAVITSADLELFYYDSESTSILGDVGAYQVNSLWVETGITWNTQPSFGASPLTTTTVPAAFTTDFRVWNLKTLYQGWFDHSIVNYGVMLSDTTEATSEGYKLFRSSDWTNTGERPKLVISYYNPAP
jgi:hypothetical protein